MKDPIVKPISTPATRETLQTLIDAARQQYGDDRFTSGDCHHLSEALYLRAHGKGTLRACIRAEADEDGTVLTTCYSHMVYADRHDETWDIDGPEADARWEAKWSDEPDEDGLVSQFEWITVPVDELRSFLLRRRAKYDNTLTAELLALSCQTETLHSVVCANLMNN